MADSRKHRGPHPHDPTFFHLQNRPALQTAVEHLAWLLSHGYNARSALKLVGDRFQLSDRQRKAVIRSSCSDASLSRRERHRVGIADLAGRDLEIDGFNLVTTVEAALSGGVVLIGRDQVARDMASMHGSYRKVTETGPALQLVGEFLAHRSVGRVHWLLDRPVSNSGRLAQMIREFGTENGWQWSAELVDDPDPLLKDSKQVVVTGDSVILDGCERWVNLARAVVAESVPDAWILNLASGGPSDKMAE